MTSLTVPPAPKSAEQRRARFVLRGLRSAAAGVVIALMLAGIFRENLWTSLVHSVSIALCCWMCMDFGRLPLARWKHRHAAPGSDDANSNWPGWPLMLPVILVGTLLGFSAGNLVAGAVTGHTAPGFFRATWQQSVAALMGALIPGLAITYWFYSRETIAAKQAAVQVAQRQAAEHQLKLLESQLEPHMLFNTLANLRVLIGIDPVRAQAMLDQLIGFLRATLSASRNAAHPLSAEFARLADYLALMQVRMGARLHTRFELPAELAGMAVPPLLLQPLVENSIKHGLEPKVEGGRIEISAARHGDVLELRVRDSGVGLSEATGDGTRFGLTQVRERLATLYGARASLELAASTGAEGGTLATIRLPLPPP